jgi:uncharacterized protein YabE (DUF348 family)
MLHDRLSVSRRPRFSGGFWPLILLAGIVSLLMLQKVSVAADSRLVQLYVDGSDSRTVMSNAPTVGEVLADARVEVNQLDLVEPALDSPVAGENYHINVFRARPVLIVDGDRRITLNTPFRSPHLIAKSAGLTVYPEDEFAIELVEDFVSDDFIGEKLTVDRATPVQVELDGHSFTFRTHRRTVAELLEEKGITLAGEDFTTLGPETELTPGLRLAVVRVGREVVTEEEVLPFETRFITDFDLPYGEIREIQAGRDGHVLHSFEVKRHNGVEVERVRIGSAEVSAAVPRIVVKGMRITGVFVNNAQILAALRQCESGGNYAANTGNDFYGAYQFMDSTWDRWNTGYDRADLAPPSVQDETVLKNARASRGGFESQHPGCHRYLGLPKFPF